MRQQLRNLFFILAVSVSACHAPEKDAPTRRPARATVGAVKAPVVFTQQIPHTDLSFRMVRIDAGVLDAPAGVNRPDVQLSDFWMGEYEMTWALVDQFGRDDPELRRRLKDTLPVDDPLFRADKVDRTVQYMMVEERAQVDRAMLARQPVWFVSQHGAQAFCRWLSIRTGRKYRLPTEAEWEYACRAGAAATAPITVAELSQVAWFGEPEDAMPHFPGLKQPNAWGLYDMLGNVAEWTLDGWSEAGITGGRNPWHPRAKGQKAGVIRGGDVQSPAECCTSTWRGCAEDFWAFAADNGWGYAHSPLKVAGHEKREWRIGFRVVSPIDPEPDDRNDLLQTESYFNDLKPQK